MPSSRPALIPRVLRVVQTLAPTRVLDLGFGFGKYGLLCREYLDLWAQPPRYKPPWTTVIDGIEGCADYVGEHQRAIYAHIFLGDAVDLMADMPADSYDLALAVDVLEHFAPDRGRQFLDEALSVSRFVLVTTPRRFQEQGEVHGNPLEVHRAHWRRSDFRALAPAVFVSDRRTTICVLSRTSPESLGKVGRGGIARSYLTRKWRKLTGRR